MLFVSEVPSGRPLLLSSGPWDNYFRTAEPRDWTTAEWRAWVHEEDLRRIDALLGTPGWYCEMGALEFRATLPGRELRWFECRYYPLPGREGERVCGLITDASEQKEREHQWECLVEQRETALREIHHRVKNNLQLVSSFLDLQMASLPAPAVEGFAAAQRRIRTMALLHEQLHDLTDPSKLDIGTYFRELARRVIATAHAGVTLEVAVDLGGAVLTLDEIIPCGLILSELLQNSLKHGLAGVEGGRVEVNFRKENNDLLLDVTDSGKGLPEDFAFGRGRSLGLRIVHALTRQLRGEVSVLSRQPAALRLRFPAPGEVRP